MTQKNIEEMFKEHDDWLKMACTCPHVKEHEIVSIPTLLSRCELTNDVCSFDCCPKKEMII